MIALALGFLLFPVFGRYIDFDSVVDELISFHIQFWTRSGMILDCFVSVTRYLYLFCSFIFDDQRKIYQDYKINVDAGNGVSD